MKIWSGLEIAHWFVDNHLQNWWQKQGCDGIDVEREGRDYCYVWVEVFVDHDYMSFIVLDVRTNINNQETRDYLFVRTFPFAYGLECQWHNKPVTFGRRIYRRERSSGADVETHYERTEDMFSQLAEWVTEGHRSYNEKVRSR